jgi:hypothetical protein
MLRALHGSCWASWKGRVAASRSSSRFFSSRVDWNEADVKDRFKRQGFRASDFKTLCARKNKILSLLIRLDLDQKVALDKNRRSQVLGAKINPFWPIYHRQLAGEKHRGTHAKS